MARRRQLFREEALARRGRAEPVDGLLRITAPHEWLFLALLAAALLGVLAWTVFGTIERGHSADCLLVGRDNVGEALSADVAGPANSQLAVLALLNPHQARDVTVGMGARVTPVVADGADGALDAVVREVMLGDSQRSEFLLDTALWDPAATHRVWLELTDDVSGAALSGSACRVRIVTEHRSPIRFIATVGLW